MASGSDHEARPRIYLLLENPSKSNNLGPILRCASAFGIVTIVAIGFSKCAVEGKLNEFGSVALHKQDQRPAL
jgi:tRNA G18 (ribose-2'-O)-methylase SpoU